MAASSIAADWMISAASVWSRPRSVRLTMTTAARKRSARAAQMLNTATLRLATAARVELGSHARTTHAAPLTGLYAAGPPAPLSSSSTTPLLKAWSAAVVIDASGVQLVTMLAPSDGAATTPRTTPPARSSTSSFIPWAPASDWSDERDPPSPYCSARKPPAVPPPSRTGTTTSMAGALSEEGAATAREPARAVLAPHPAGRPSRGSWSPVQRTGDPAALVRTRPWLFPSAVARAVRSAMAAGFAVVLPSATARIGSWSAAMSRAETRPEMTRAREPAACSPALERRVLTWSVMADPPREVLSRATVTREASPMAATRAAVRRRTIPRRRRVPGSGRVVPGGR